MQLGTLGQWQVSASPMLGDALGGFVKAKDDSDDE